MEYKFDFVNLILSMIMALVVSLYACNLGYKKGINEMKEQLQELCVKTNGQYEFCNEKKIWEVKDLK